MIIIIIIIIVDPNRGVISKEFGADNVTVIVEWAQQTGDLYYTVRLSPLAPTLLTENTSRQLTLSYNIGYNLTVVAVTPCGNTTAFNRLHYNNMVRNTQK